MKELAGCVGAARAARIARRKLRGAICAARCTRREVAQFRGAIELKCGPELKWGARRGGGEQALVIPGVVISVDVDFHLCVVHGARVFARVTREVGQEQKMRARTKKYARSPRGSTSR